MEIEARVKEGLFTLLRAHNAGLNLLSQLTEKAPSEAKELASHRRHTMTFHLNSRAALERQVGAARLDELEKEVHAEMARASLRAKEEAMAGPETHQQGKETRKVVIEADACKQNLGFHQFGHTGTEVSQWNADNVVLFQDSPLNAAENAAVTSWVSIGLLPYKELGQSMKCILGRYLCRKHPHALALRELPRRRLSR